jgi:AraC-like DNA-binding protein
MARPPIEIDMEQLAAFMRLMPTEADAAAYFKCSVDTIARRIKDETGLSFAEFREQNMVHTRMKLVRTAIKQAESGNTAMLIFCLKNVNKWKDKQEIEHTGDAVREESDEQLKARAAELARKLNLGGIVGDGAGSGNT